MQIRCSNLLDLIVAVTATTSVQASMDPNKAAYCEAQHLSYSWKMYNIIGIMRAQLPATTTTKAKMITGAATWHAHTVTTHPFPMQS